MVLPAQQKVEMFGVRHCYVESNNAGVIAFHRVWLTKKCEVKVSSQKLEFAGDGQKYHKNYGYMAEGQVEASVDDTTLDGLLWNTPGVANNGTTDDFSVRFIKGGSAEMASNFVGLRITIDAEDADTGALMVVRYRILKIQFDPDTPAPAQSQAVVSRMLNWSARPAKADIAGATLTGMPANGCFWIKDYVVDATKFDPVAGDIL